MTTIDLNRISVFVRVVEHKSFTAAAKELRLPASSVSRAVANLEEELGVRLLHRTTRKLSLTDPGEHFFRRMQTVIAEAEDATRAVTGFAHEPKGVVRITAPPDIGSQELPRVISRILQKHAGLTIELTLTNRRVDIVAEGIDLAIRGGNLSDSSLVARKIVETDMGLFAAPSYLERHGRPRVLDDLKKLDCLRFGERALSLPWRFTGPRGEESIAVTGSMACDDMIFLREAAAYGSGVTLLPMPLAIPLVKAKKLERVLPRYSLLGGALNLVWASNKLVPAHVVVVRELLLRELAHAYR